MIWSETSWLPGQNQLPFSSSTISNLHILSPGCEINTRQKVKRRGVAGLPFGHSYNFHMIVVQSLSSVWLFATPQVAAMQASLFLTISKVCPNSGPLHRWWQIFPKISHLILWYPLLLLLSIFTNLRVFFNNLALCIKCPKYWSFSFRVSSNKYSHLNSMNLYGNSYLFFIHLSI